MIPRFIPENVYPDDVLSILQVGHCLEESGINNWALSFDEAIQAVEKLLAILVPISGLDPLERSNGLYTYTNEHWGCNPLKDETRRDYAVRSCTESLRYLRKYYKPEDKFSYLVTPAVRQSKPDMWGNRKPLVYPED